MSDAAIAEPHDLLCGVCSGIGGTMGRVIGGSVDVIACPNAACVDILSRSLRAMPNPYEASALAAAGKAGGELLMTFGQTDLRQLTRDQYSKFVFEIVAVWRAELAALAAARADCDQRGARHG